MIVQCCGEKVREDGHLSGKTGRSHLKRPSATVRPKCADEAFGELYRRAKARTWRTWRSYTPRRFIPLELPALVLRLYPCSFRRSAVLGLMDEMDMMDATGDTHCSLLQKSVVAPSHFAGFTGPNRPRASAYTRMARFAIRAVALAL